MNPLTDIKAAIFDFDNTLYSEKLYFELVINTFCEKQKLSKSLADEILLQYMKVRPTSKNIFRDILDPFDLYTKENSDSFFKIYTEIDGAIELFPDTLPILDFLRNKSVKLGLLTNGLILAQKNKLRLAGINNYFDEIVYARMFGNEFEKPHPKTFEYILDKMKVSPENSIFVGDNLATDFEAPSQLGSKTIYLNRDNIKAESDFVNFSISGLLELKDILSESKKSH